MNETCVYTKLLQEIMNVGEITDCTLEVSTNGTTWGTNNIPAEQNEVLEVSYANVTIEVE